MKLMIKIKDNDKRYIIYWETMIRMTIDFSSAITDIKRPWKIFLRAARKKRQKNPVLHPETISFRNKGKMN